MAPPRSSEKQTFCSHDPSLNLDEKITEMRQAPNTLMVKAGTIDAGMVTNVQLGQREKIITALTDDITAELSKEMENICSSG
jgi:hypothetical protein